MRRIKKAKVRLISLVPKGANKLPVLYKDADGGSFEMRTLTKFDDERGELLAVVYAPEFRDSQGDIASAEVIKDMAYSFAKDGSGVDILHDDKPLEKDDVYVAESFIIQKGDARFQTMKDYDGQPVDVTGGWAVVLKIDNEDLKKRYRDGEWDGVSLAGRAEVEPDHTDVVKSLFSDIRQALGITAAKETEMTKEEITALVAETVAATLEKTKTVETKTETAPETKTPEPVFKGDPLNPADVKAHAEKLQREEILSKVDWTDAESVKAYQATLEKIVKGAGAEPAGDEAKPDAKILKLEAELAKLKKASGQPNGAGDGNAELTKEQRQLSLAQKIAKHANEMVG